MEEERRGWRAGWPMMIEEAVGERRPVEVESKAEDVAEAGRGLQRFPIRKGDLETHGYTKGCGGCRTALRSAKHNQKHTQECRERLEKAVQGEDKVRESKKREMEWLVDEVEKEAGKKKVTKNTGGGSGMGEGGSNSSSCVKRDGGGGDGGIGKNKGLGERTERRMMT